MGESVAGIASGALTTFQGLLGSLTPVLVIFVGVLAFGLVVSIVTRAKR